MIRNAVVTVAAVCVAPLGASIPTRSSAAWRSEAIVASPTQPSASEARVIPSCVAEM